MLNKVIRQMELTVKWFVKINAAGEKWKSMFPMYEKDTKISAYLQIEPNNPRNTDHLKHNWQWQIAKSSWLLA